MTLERKNPTLLTDQIKRPWHKPAPLLCRGDGSLLALSCHFLKSSDTFDFKSAANIALAFGCQTLHLDWNNCRFLVSCIECQVWDPGVPRLLTLLNIPTVPILDLISSSVAAFPNFSFDVWFCCFRPVGTTKLSRHTAVRYLPDLPR